MGDCKGCDWLLSIKSKDDPLKVCELKVSIAKLHKDQRYFGYVVLYYKHHMPQELCDLSDDDAQKFFDDLLLITKAMQKTLKPDRFNYALLGNIQSHMHWHIIPRRKSDANWGTAIWKEPQPEKTLSEIDYLELSRKIRENIKT